MVENELIKEILHNNPSITYVLMLIVLVLINLIVAKVVIFAYKTSKRFFAIRKMHKAEKEFASRTPMKDLMPDYLKAIEARRVSINKPSES